MFSVRPTPPRRPRAATRLSWADERTAPAYSVEHTRIHRFGTVPRSPAGTGTHSGGCGCAARRPLRPRGALDEELGGWRAVCGRTARMFRRAGGRKPLPDPYRDRNRPFRLERMTRLMTALAVF